MKYYQISILWEKDDANMIICSFTFSEWSSIKSAFLLSGSKCRIQVVNDFIMRVVIKEPFSRHRSVFKAHGDLFVFA